MPRALFASAAIAALLASGGLAHANLPDCYDTSSPECDDGPSTSLPSSVDEFIATRDKLARDPWGGATMFLMAWMVRATNPTLGDQMLVLSLAEGQLTKMSRGGVYKGYGFGRGLSYHMNNLNKSYPYCRTAYAVGATRANKYTFDARSVKVRFRKQTRLVGSIESGKYKVFACSEGTATCRPLTMVRNSKGLWKVDNFSSISTGCAQPVKDGPSAADEL
jgi:hypothetical protein